MGRFTKIAFGGLAAALLAASGVFAGEFLLADFENGKESYLDNYFYLYDSDPKTSAGEGKFTSAGPADEYGPFSFIPLDGSAGTGNFSGGFDIEGYQATDDGGDCINSYGDARCDPTWGMGILLTANDHTGYGDAFKKVTAVRMKLKYSAGAAATLGVRFKVETIHNTETEEFKYPGIPVDKIPMENGTKPPYKAKTANAYSLVIRVPKGDNWLDTTVLIDGNNKAPAEPNTAIASAVSASFGKYGQLQQAGWWGYHFEFKREQATHIAWQIDADLNAGLEASEGIVSFRVDDVYLVGPDVDESFYVSKDKCSGCILPAFDPPAATKGELLSDFEADDPLANWLGYYWYTYTDKDATGTSQILGLVTNPNMPSGDKIMDVKGNGRDGTNGAYIEFEMGTRFTKPNTTTEISPFVGIGTNLADTAKKDWFDATIYDGIYFEYMTTSNVDWLYVELADSYDMLDEIGGPGGTSNGTPDGDDDGEVFYTRIPGTGGEWKAVRVHFGKFVLAQWVTENGKRRKDAPKNVLKLSELAQLKFKRQGGAQGDGGQIAIDNVYFFGDGTGQNSVKLVGSKAAWWLPPPYRLPAAGSRRS